MITQNPGVAGVLHLKENILMDTWMKVSYALVLGAMVVFLLPRAKAMLKDTPKATSSDWKSVVIPIIGVILFIILLINMV